jgi:hypothetical protein
MVFGILELSRARPPIRIPRIFLQNIVDFLTAYNKKIFGKFFGWFSIIK